MFRFHYGLASVVDNVWRIMTHRKGRRRYHHAKGWTVGRLDPAGSWNMKEAMLSPKHLSNTSVNMPIDFSKMFLYVSMIFYEFVPLCCQEWTSFIAKLKCSKCHKQCAFSTSHWPSSAAAQQLRTHLKWHDVENPSILNGKPWVFQFSTSILVYPRALG